MKKLITTTFLALMFCTYGQQITTVKDICSGSQGSHPKHFIEFENKLFFNANDGIHGEELWVSEGTEATTQLFMDLNSTSGSDPYNFKVIGNKMYFSADDGVNGRELWITDGTVSGTFMVKDINPNGSSTPFWFTELNSGKVVFAALDDVHGVEPWITDGTSSGTVLLKEIQPGGIHNSPSSFKFFNGEVYFRADDGIHGYELWKTDGTNAGTVRVTDINTSTSQGSLVQQEFQEYNGELYFIASDNSNGVELWKTNGSTNGTSLVKDINHLGSSTPHFLTVYNGELYFVAYSTNYGEELWKTDGTFSGTVQVKDIASGSLSSSPSNLIVYNGLLYFNADDQDQGQQNVELWSTDGSSSGTGLHYNFSNSPTGGWPSVLTVVSNELVMKATHDVLGVQLYVQSGHTSPQLVYPTGASGGLDATNEFINYQGKLFYIADYYPSVGLELYMYDGLASIEKNEDEKVKIYPNPFEKTITIQDIEGIKEIAVFNMLGKQVLQKITINNTVDLSILDRGVYILQIKKGPTQQEFKIIKN